MPKEPFTTSNRADDGESLRFIGLAVPAGGLDDLFPPLAAYSLDEVNVAADAAIAEYKRRQAKPPPVEHGSRWDRLGRRYVWDQPLWYRRGGDAWIDDSWWIEAAKSDLTKNQWPVRSLNILLGFGFHEYRVEAARLVEDWHEQNRCDPEGFIGLMTHLYPDHPIAREYVDGFAENELGEAEAFLLRHRDPRAIGRVVSAIREDLAERQTELKVDPAKRQTSCDCFLLQHLRKLGRQNALVVLTAHELAAIHNAARAVACCGDLDALWLSSRAALECALEIGWPDVAEEFQRNAKYPCVLLARQVGHKEERGSPRLSKMPWRPPSLRVPDTSDAALVWSLLMPGDCHWKETDHAPAPASTGSHRAKGIYRRRAARRRCMRCLARWHRAILPAAGDREIAPHHLPRSPTQDRPGEPDLLNG